MKCCDGSILYSIGEDRLCGGFLFSFCIMNILACGIASAVVCFVW